MDHLKEGIGLKAYAQKDPLNEYKRESFGMFENMRIEVKKAVIDTMFRVQLYTKDEIDDMKRIQQAELKSKLDAHKQLEKAKEEGKGLPVTRSKQKVGRNEPCPCGSGKKFKHCHGA